MRLWKFSSAVVILLMSVLNSFSQTTSMPVSEIEKRIHARLFQSGSLDYKSDTNINVTYYDLNLRVTYNPNLLSGYVIINSFSKVNNLSTSYFDLQDNMTVDSVLLDGSATAINHSQNKIVLNFPNAINAGENFSVKILYHGIPDVTGFGSFVFGSHNNGTEPAIWTLSEPYGASDWFPCKNTPSDKADSSDVIIRCDENLIPVSNGDLISILNNGDGTHSYHWHNSYTIANYLISLAISNYSQHNFFYRYSQNDSMPVTNYIYPEDLNEVIPLLNKTTTMLTLFSNSFGLYPFIDEKYGYAQFGEQGGMEHQTISSMGVFGESIMAHELAHQWFGDMITCRDWENIWLNEGFATFCEAVYAEHAYGKNAYDEFIKNRMSNAKTATGSVYVQDVNSISEIFSGNRTYAKGCVVLHMLRGITGDLMFFNILKEYSNDTTLKYKTAVTEDFQNVAEKIYGKSLDYFFHEWIYGENYPKYNVSMNTENLGNGNYKASVVLQQDLNTSPSFFTMPVNIKIITIAGDSLFTVFNDSQVQSFEFIVNSKPLDFRIDPDNWILKDVRGENIVPVSFALGQNYPNPFNPLTNIPYTLGRPSNIEIEIYDILGKKVREFHEGTKREGSYSVVFNASDLSSGVYFARITAKDIEAVDLIFEDTKRMLYVK